MHEGFKFIINGKETTYENFCLLVNSGNYRTHYLEKHIRATLKKPIILGDLISLNDKQTFMRDKKQELKEQKVIEDWNRKEEAGMSTRHKANAPFFLDEVITWKTTPTDANCYQTTNGKKETEGKIDYSEIDWDFVTQLACRMNQNKGKYPANNWKKRIEIEFLKQSLFRHVIAVMNGEYEDDGRKLGHLESIALNAQFLNYQLKNYK